ncbi:MAG: autotransporter-associated beta strand repeat-containing protein [Verrucomicrobiota bacterium]
MNTRSQTLNPLSSSTDRLRGLVTSAIAGFAMMLPAFAADEIWDGETDNTISTPTNWVSDAVPGPADQGRFDDSGVGGVIIDVDNTTIGNLLFNQADTAAWIIGTGGPKSQTFTIGAGAENGDGVIVQAAVPNPITVDANIIAEDTMRIHNDSAETLTINGDVTLGPGITDNETLNFGDFNSLATNIVMNGDIGRDPTTTGRFQFNVNGAEVIFNGDVDQTTGNQFRTVVRDAGSLTVSSTGLLGQGSITVSNGTLHLESDQFSDDGFSIGNATIGNGNALLMIDPGVTLELDAGLTYIADDDTANMATITGGTIDLSGGARTYTVNDNPLVTDSELTLSTTFKGNGDTNATAEDFAFTGPGTLTWDSTLDTSVAGEFVDLIIFQTGKTIIGPNGTDFTGMRRELVVRQEDNVDPNRSSHAVELDINGHEVVLDDDLVIGQFQNDVINVIQPVTIVDSADSPTSRIRFIDDNDVTVQDGLNGAIGVADNTMATISADLHFENSGFAFNVQDGASDVDLLVTGTITEDDGSRDMSKNDGGTLKLTATDNSFDLLFLNAGTLIIESDTNIGTDDIQLGATSTNGTLLYEGPGETIDNQFRIGNNTAGSTGSSTLLNNGTGVLTISQGTFNQARATADQPKTLTLGGTADGVISGNIVDNNTINGATVGVIKTGANTWDLNGANTYSGDTIIEEGRLNLDGNYAGNLTVADGGSVGGDASFDGMVTLGTSTGVNLHIDGVTPAALTAGGDISTSAGVTVFVDVAGGDAFTVLNYDSTATNNIDVSHFTLAPGVPTSDRSPGGGFIDTGSSITLDLGFATRTWDNSTADNLWNEGAGSSTNWVEGDNLFFDGDIVIFDDTVGSNQTVAVAADVEPGGIMFNNNTDTFTINDNGGGEAISGETSLTKSGEADVTINNANSYTGGTFLRQGILNIDNTTALGTGVFNLIDEGNNPDLTLLSDGLVIANELVISNIGSRKDISFNPSGQGNEAEFTGDIDIQETANWPFQIYPGTGDTIIFSGVVSGVGNPRMRGNGGFLRLTNPANSFDDPLWVDSNGTTEILSIADEGVNSAAGAGLAGGDNVDVRFGNDNSNGTVSYIGTGDSTNRQVQIGITNGNDAPGDQSTGAGALQSNGTGALIFTNAAFNLADDDAEGRVGARTLTIGGANTDDNEIQGAIIDNAGIQGGTSLTPPDNTVSLVKDDAGKWILSGANTFTGGVTVNDGTLLVNNSSGSGTGTGDVTVSGGTLGGTGTISGTVFAGSAGNVSPGASPGTLTVDGNFDCTALAGGSGQLVFELDALASTNDLISVGGTLNIGSGLLGLGDISTTDLGGLEVGTYTLVSASAITGTLDGADTTGTLSGFGTTLQITGSNLELVVAVGGADPFDTWALANGLDDSPGMESGKGDDPDNSGNPNAFEFAFNGDPLNPSSNGLIAELLQDASTPAGEELTIIIAVRDGATFTASGTSPNVVQTATVDGVTYTVQGATSAVFPNADVSQVSGPSDTAPAGSGLPDLTGTDWEYHTFKLDISEPTVSGEKGQIRVELNY